MQSYPGELQIYKSFGKAPGTSESVQNPISFVNSLQLPSLSSHRPQLKAGALIMFFWNPDSLKLRNRTRVPVNQLLQNIIETTVLTGVSKEESVFISTIQVIQVTSFPNEV